MLATGGATGLAAKKRARRLIPGRRALVPNLRGGSGRSSNPLVDGDLALHAHLLVVGDRAVELVVARLQVHRQCPALARRHVPLDLLVVTGGDVLDLERVRHPVLPSLLLEPQPTIGTAVAAPIASSAAKRRLSRIHTSAAFVGTCLSCYAPDLSADCVGARVHRRRSRGATRFVFTRRQPAPTARLVGAAARGRARRGARGGPAAGRAQPRQPVGSGAPRPRAAPGQAP